MKNCIHLVMIFVLVACNGGGNNNSINTNTLESEIISQTINTLTPKIPEIRLIVPKEGGEESSKYEAREEAFWPEHNRIKKNDGAYFILANDLTIPIPGERYTTKYGLSNSFTEFLYHSAKTKPISLTDIKRLYGLHVKRRNINTEDFKSLNKPGSYGYIEYSRMLFSDNNTEAQFIFKYRLNNGMDITQLISVKKHGNKWQIENKEDLLVSYETPDSPIEPTGIIDTLYAPPYNDDSFEIKFDTDLKSKNPLPREHEIIITVKQNAFDTDFLKYVDFEFSLDRTSNDIENIDFTKLNETTYRLKINECYSEPFIEYDVRITPKRGYVYSDFLTASQSQRYVDHINAASLGVWIISIDQTNVTNCK